MTIKEAVRVHPLSVAAALTAAALLGGCATYTPRELSAMSAADICEVEYMQGRNLSPDAKQAIQSELRRRNDDCRNHAVEVAQRYETFMYREMYGRPDTN